MASIGGGLSHVTRKSMAMGPTVRTLLSQYQLDPSKIAASGPHHTLLKCDVIAHISQQNLQPSSQAATSQVAPKIFKPNLDLTGYQPKPGPEGFSEIAKKLLDP